MELRKRVLTAVGWSAAAKFGGQLVTWIITIIVIRLLEPADYGLMAMAALLIEFFTLINPMGAALIQRERLDEKTVRQIFGLMILINLGFFAALFVAAPLISGFFREPQLVALVRVLSLQFLILPFVQLSSALLERELDLKKTSIVYLVAQLGGSAVTLILALRGFGVWSLIGGAIAIEMVRAVGFLVVARCNCLPSYSFNGMRGIISFGSFVTGERLMWYAYTRADAFIIGRVLDKELLGIYTVANHLASLLMHKTGEILYVVSLPAFSRIQSEREKVVAYFLKSVRMMSFMLFPLFFGMSSVAPKLVAVVLGEKWSSAAQVLAILCLVMPLRMISNLYAPLLQGIGRADLSASNLLVVTGIMPLAFLIGTDWGLVGVSVAWLIGHPVAFAIMTKRALSCLGAGINQFFVALIHPAFLSGIMLVVVLATKSTIATNAQPLVQLVALVLTSMITYAILVLSLHRQIVRELEALVP